MWLNIIESEFERSNYAARKTLYCRTKMTENGTDDLFPNSRPIRQFKIIDRLYFQDFVACSIFWCMPTWNANKFL